MEWKNLHERIDELNEEQAAQVEAFVETLQLRAPQLANSTATKKPSTMANTIDRSEPSLKGNSHFLEIVAYECALTDEEKKAGKYRNGFGAGKGYFELKPGFNDPIEDFDEY